MVIAYCILYRTSLLTIWKNIVWNFPIIGSIIVHMLKSTESEEAYAILKEISLTTSIKYVFPEEKSVMVRDLGYMNPNDFPEEYHGVPHFNF